MESKFALSSKSVQGLILAGLAHFAPLLGIELTGKAEAFVADFLTLLGLIWAMWGRYTAETPIHFMRRKPAGMTVPALTCIIGAAALALVMVQACGTIRAVKADPHDYGAIAAASCSDLTNGVTVSRAALPWIEVYFPAKRKQITRDIEPVLEDAALGVDAYCEAAGLVTSAQGWSALLVERDRLLALSSKVAALIAAIRQ